MSELSADRITAAVRHSTVSGNSRQGQRDQQNAVLDQSKRL
tara:strand:- start:408 stop:530 length:123 start_codon:yes stop_codon:yes gene_type:complete